MKLRVALVAPALALAAAPAGDVEGAVRTPISTLV